MKFLRTHMADTYWLDVFVEIYMENNIEIQICLSRLKIDLDGPQIYFQFVSLGEPMGHSKGLGLCSQLPKKPLAAEIKKNASKMERNDWEMEAIIEDLKNKVV